jgi:hypothetical protein
VQEKEDPQHNQDVMKGCDGRRHPEMEVEPLSQVNEDTRKGYDDGQNCRFTKILAHGGADGGLTLYHEVVFRKRLPQNGRQFLRPMTGRPPRALHSHDERSFARNLLQLIISDTVPNKGLAHIIHPEVPFRFELGNRSAGEVHPEVSLPAEGLYHCEKPQQNEGG